MYGNMQLRRLQTSAIFGRSPDTFDHLEAFTRIFVPQADSVFC